MVLTSLCWDDFDVFLHHFTVLGKDQTTLAVPFEHSFNVDSVVLGMGLKLQAVPHQVFHFHCF